MGIRKQVNKLIKPLSFKLELINDQTERYDLLYDNFPEESLKKKCFLNVGAGQFSHHYWTNIDKASEWYKCDQIQEKFIDWDMMTNTPLPFDDNSIELIYCSHTLEHVPDEAAAYFFSEASRVLKNKGGTMRILVPDMMLAYWAYCNNDRDFFHAFKLPDSVSAIDPNVPIHQIFLYVFATSLSSLFPHDFKQKHFDKSEFESVFKKESFENAMDSVIDYIDFSKHFQFPGNHVNWWTESKAIWMIRKAGFNRVIKSGFGQSSQAVLRDTTYFDKKNLHKISLFIEAMKV
jgi:predicted SAM-dependent methyltransferase